MFKYHSYRGETFDNAHALLFGVRGLIFEDMDWRKKAYGHKYNNIIKDFQDNGFIVGHQGNTDFIWTQGFKDINFKYLYD